MSLDFAILDANGAPAALVGFDASEHDALIELAIACSANKLLRAKDYYREAHYENKDIQELLVELSQMRQCCVQVALSTKLDELAALARVAGLKGNCIEVLPD